MGKTDWKAKISGMGTKKQQLLILLLLGVLLAVIAVPEGGRKSQTDTSQKSVGGEGNTADDYEVKMEEKLSGLLETVYGVGKNKVMITLKSTSEKVIEKDGEKSEQSVAEEDSQGGTRTTTDISSGETTVYRGTNENQMPYVTKEMTPEIEGVVVIAEGGGNPETARNIIEAVQALFDVDTHKIKIMKMNQKK